MKISNPLPAALLSLGLLACGSNVTPSENPTEPTSATASTATAPATEENVEAPDPGGIPERGDDAERPSKNGEVVMTSGSLTTTIRYGRPNVNGRTIFGDLVAYDSIWRTGANEATTITFSEAATFGGTAVDAGTYSFFAIPGETEWTLILNRDAQQWGASRYDEAQDAARVTVTPSAAAAMEEMTFADEGGNLVLRWAEVGVPVPVAAN
ncbi:MAG: hypothetical protein ACI9KE_005561 [Polyangiales bacterium]|jgi:hypothetical protein